MTGRDAAADRANDNIFAQRVAQIVELCVQSANVASAAYHTTPATMEGRGEGRERTFELFLVLHEKRAVAEMKKEFTSPTRIRLANWEGAEPREWKALGPQYQVVRDATPASKSDAKLLMAALTGGDESMPQPQRKRPASSGRRTAVEMPIAREFKRQKLSSGRIATVFEAQAYVQPSRSGKRR